MQVIKRNGSRQELDITQIRKQTIDACAGLDINYEELEFSSKINFHDNITTRAIQHTLINTAISKITEYSPNWTYVAARLSLYDLYHKIKHHYSIPKNINGESVYDLVPLSMYINQNKDILSDWTSKYSDSDIAILEKAINPDRDLLYDYAGFSLMCNMYLLKRDGDIVELPQYLHMSVAMYCMQNEDTRKRLDLVLDTYEMLSKLEFICATPINSNGRKKDGGLISCLINTVEDSTDSITDIMGELAHGSRNGAGFGVDITRIRSVGSSIGSSGVSGGKIPFCKVFNDIMLAWNQGSVRNGSACIYTECWDLEIYDFINLKRDGGEERRRCRDLYLGIMYCDLFFKREAENGTWILFDPKDVPLLTELDGDEFEKAYLDYEKDYYRNPLNYNINTKAIACKDLLKHHIKTWVETGMPFIGFKDTINRTNPYKDIGRIRSSNLCVEVVVITDNKYTGVCNLGSINCSKFKDLEQLGNVIRLATRLLDNCIDLTKYPSVKAYNFQRDFRAIGMGMLGIGEYLANNKIHYGSDEHKEKVNVIWRFIRDTIKKTSEELADEKGSCKHNFGYRNAYFMAIAPNSSSAIFAGTTNGLEPVFDRCWTEENKRGSFTMVAPHLTNENREYYKNPYEIDMFSQLDITAIRQQYIDMSQSQNIYIDPEKHTIKYIRDLIVHAWSKGIKTLYYCRSKAPKKHKPEITCVGCEN